MYLIATEAVGALLGLLFWAVAARLLPDAEVGVGAVLITSGTLLAILSTLGLNISLVRFLPERGTRVARLINSSATLGVVTAVVLALSFGVASGSWLPALAFLSTNPALIVLFAFFVSVWTVYLLFDAAFIGLGKAKYVLLRAVVYNGLKVPLPALLAAVFTASASPFALFSAWGIGLLVANVLAAAVLFATAVPAFRLRPDVDRSAIRSMFRYSAANHVTNVLGAMPGLVLPFMVAIVLSPQNAAYFYVAWVIANLLFIVPGSIFTSVFAEGSRWLPGLRGHALDGLYLSLAILVPMVAAVLLAGPTVLGALKPSYRDAAVPLVNLLAVSAFFVVINVLYITVLRVGKRMRPVVGIYLGTTLGALALAFPLMLKFGLVGAGAAFAVSQGVGAVYCTWAMLREGVLRRGG
jgi:O-antigen/teichoic acid export membrane protein